MIATTLLILGGCASIDAFERGAIEPKTDEYYDASIQRWCELPIDVHMRAIDRGTLTIDSLAALCPDWARARDMFLEEAVISQITS